MARRMTTFLLLAGLVLVLAAAPAFAAKGGNDKVGVTGSITLQSAARLAAGTSGPSYGDTISFDTNVDGKLSPKATVYITVVCTQGDTVVYQYSGAPNSAFPLADQAGQGLEWDGGEADCSATLIYRVPKGKSYDITWLDVERFHAYEA